MPLPEGYGPRKLEHLCKLNRTLYRLKPSPWAWYQRIDAYYLQNDFKKNNADTNVYHVKHDGDKFLVLALYVGDAILASNCVEIL